MKPVTLLGLAVLSAILPNLAQASIIDDSTTYFHYVDPEGNFVTDRRNNLFDDRFDGIEGSSGMYVDAYASIERGVIRMNLDSKSGPSFPRFSASVRDFYVLSGSAVDVDASMDGIQVNVPVTLTLEGTARETFIGSPLNEVRGKLRTALEIGRDWSSTSHGVLGGNPVIQDIGGRISSDTVVLNYGNGSVDIDESVTANLKVTLGEEFQLAYAVILTPTFGVNADLMNSATVNFGLNDDLQLTSRNGFGAPGDANPVPEPSSLLIFGSVAACLAGVLARRRRHAAKQPRSSS